MPGSPFGQSPGLPPGSRYLKLIKIANMKKIIFAALILGIIAMSWQPHCDHTFVAVEQPEIKVHPMPTMTYAIPNATIGNAQGKDIICIKCFHRQHQVINYGSVDHQLLSEIDKGFKYSGFGSTTRISAGTTDTALRLFIPSNWTNGRFDTVLICPEPPKVWMMDSTGNLIQVLKTCW